ncbi:hypothetical protein D3C87_828870 [compost metagenome]
MRSHLLLIKIFFVVVGVWLYVIHPTHIPATLKLGPAPIIEQAASFRFPEIKSSPEEDVARISGEHRELSLREVSSVGKPIIKDHQSSPVETSKTDIKSRHFQ